MGDRIDEMRAFTRVVALGSFSSAARELALAQPTVSRLVANLERRLGARLVLRTTHEVTPTEAGLAFAIHARAIIDQLDEAEQAARGADSLNGTLRLAAPATFGVRVLTPILADFLERHPQLKVELASRDEPEPLITQAIDVAIRFGAPPDSMFGARRLGVLPRVVVASPAYLARRGTPETPDDLAGHECVFGPGLTARKAWRFSGSAHLTTDLRGRVRVATAEGVVAAAVAGLGVAVSTRLMCQDELSAGRLVELLPGLGLEPVELHALLPAGRAPSAKARAFLDFLVPRLSARGVDADSA